MLLQKVLDIQNEYSQNTLHRAAQQDSADLTNLQMFRQRTMRK